MKIRTTILVLTSLGFFSCNRQESVVADDPRNTIAVPLGHSAEEKDKAEKREEEERARENGIVDPNSEKGMNK